MTSTATGPTDATRQQAGSAQGQSADPHHDRRWLVLLVVAIAQLMVVLDATIVNIALPSAQKALHFANTDRQWIVTAYALPFGSLLLLGGKFGDLFGRKRAFMVGLAGFALASALGGAAQSFGVLVASRALQGVFGALLAPSALATLATTFTDPKERSRAFGVFGAVAGGGAAVGLLLGGILTEYLSWRWCLFVNLAFAGIALVGATLLLTNARAPRRPKLDVPGTLLASSGLFCMVYGFSKASTDGWGNATTIIFLVAAVVLLVSFVVVESRVSAPLLPLHVLTSRVRGGSYLAVVVSATAIFGVSLFLTFYLQQVKGFSPIMSGLAFLPMTACIVAASTTSNIVLLPRTGPRPLTTTGMVLGAISMFLLSRLTPDSGYAGHVLPYLLILGFAFGLIFAPSINSATFGIAGPEAGVASAMVNTSQQVGGSIGTALLSTVAASASTAYVTSHRPSGAGAAAQAALGTLAAVHGFDRAFLISALIFAVGAVAIGLLLPSGVLSQQAAAPQPAQRPQGEPAQAAAPVQQAPVQQAPAQPVAPPASSSERVSAQPVAPVAAAAPTVAAAGPSSSPARTDDTGPAAPQGPPWSVWGRVLHPDGTPQPDVALTLTDMTGDQIARTRSDAQGAYLLAPPTPGTYLIICVASDFRPAATTVTVAGTHVRRDLQLVGAGRIGGVVRSGGGPLADARLTLMDDRGDIVGATSTGQDGGYLLDDLHSGEYTLTVSAPAHRPDVSSVSVPAHQLVGIDVDLVAGGELVGTVRAVSDGRVLPESIVTLLDPHGTVVARGFTDAHGQYRFPDVVPGSYTVTAAGFAPTTTRVDVTSGDNLIPDIGLGWAVDPTSNGNGTGNGTGNGSSNGHARGRADSGGAGLREER